MDNLRSVIELLFAKRELKEVLGNVNNIGGDERTIIDKDTFKNLFLKEYHRYSGNQLDSLFDITNDTWSLANPQDDSVNNQQKNVFNILLSFAKQVLTMNGDMPCCQYKHYLRWHEATELLAEDVFVTNFLADYDLSKGFERTNFSWMPYLLANDQRLTYIMSKGLAELHNHLYGASLVFTLNWLELMNFPEPYNHTKFKNIRYMDDCHRKVTLAAFIRSILYKCVTPCVVDDTIESIFIRWYFEQDKLRYMNVALRDVQRFIARLRLGKRDSVDYAIPTHLVISASEVSNRNVLVGERILLYKCFQKINRGESNQLFRTLLYIYLMIKVQFRLAMVQVNKDFGFENFSKYNSTKCNFVSDRRLYKNKFAEAALGVAVQQTFVKHIEYRISPDKTPAEIYRHIRKLSVAAGRIRELSSIESGYILHFIKTKDRVLTNSLLDGLVCRNSKARLRFRKEANSIKHLIEHGNTCINGNTRIIGIDAASSEFYCRPEVFGVVFRRLRNVQPMPVRGYMNNLRPFKLGVTYHVGEDFYDVIDGLRAIDEALIFLNLTNGDRIGHGTALGIDVHHYYEEKHFTVVMPKQVLLDNMAWLLDKETMCASVDSSGFMYVVRRKFESLYNEVYGGYGDVPQPIAYYNSWLLRGDEPKMYLGGRFSYDGIDSNCNVYYRDSEDIINEARHTPKARILYYRYHYDSDAKARGNKPVEWKIETIHRQSFVKILERIQEKMQNIIAHKHIAIECNPTSNLRIGNIPKYVQHPIVKFYNEGLRRTTGEFENGPQISASINTDDAGIFATSLEKEYTLMALALEKEPDENGEPKYNQQSVYRWLENVRENAMAQRFNCAGNE